MSLSTSIILQWSLLSLIIYVIIIIIKWLYFKWNLYNYFQRKSIPYPPISFLFGNLSVFVKNQFEALNNWTKKYGKCFGFLFGNHPVIVVSDRDAVQEILVKNGYKFPNRHKSDVEMEPFRSSLLFQEDKAWRHARRILTPTFTAHKMTMESTRQAIDLS
ncbi:hypothetical protein BLA29_011303, partial [Euroglyphus maynei]